MRKYKQPLSYSEVLAKVMRFCAYQERSSFEVEQKIRTFGLPMEKNDEILQLLIDDNFISDERFATAFVRGKVNAKRWGKFKIIQGLMSKGIRGELAENAIRNIDLNKYQANLNELATKKYQQLAGSEKIREKLYMYLSSKGYESDLILKEMDSVTKEFNQ